MDPTHGDKFSSQHAPAEFASHDLQQQQQQQPNQRGESITNANMDTLSSTATATATAATTNIPSTIGSLIQSHPPGIKYIQYSLDLEPTYLPQIRDLIASDLSEPYSIYVYRYFLYQWPSLCFMAVDTSAPPSSPTTTPSASPLSPTTTTTTTTTTQDKTKGGAEGRTSAPSPAHPPLAACVICKLERHRSGPLRGYIAMLATHTSHRGKGLATTLVSKSIDLMMSLDADEIALETEETNKAAIKLYERLGFVRSKKLHRYYLNGNSAFRLLLYLKGGEGRRRGGLEGGEDGVGDGFGYEYGYGYGYGVDVGVDAGSS